MYSIKKVSELLNIPVVTIRAWENRYNIISPTRTDGGHRSYSEADIEILKWLKDEMNKKHIKISEAVSLLKQRKNSITKSGKDSPINQFSYHDDLIDKLYQNLIALDGEKANALIDLAFSLFPFETVFHKILIPVLCRIGEQWECGAVKVAQEHFASELVLTRFQQFFRILPIRFHTPRAIAFCPEGELHHIGLMLFCLFLRNKGLEVIYLGPNTPYSGLTDIIEMKNISIVSISLTNPTLTAELEDWIKICKEQFSNIKFVLGGGNLDLFPQSLSPYVITGDYDDWENWFASIINNSEYLA
ncbi:MerR family transcriptional regulator [Cohnella sp. LGH]|uniref:MerR family transcriptional regulator n=1 Tax=Cohnella sp. LGH TaxID=1619153 RepID=UPI001ADB60AB|nr:MerR family transcriptional regulator [Cohnella sp. LGH]QTH43888.1 MerR family transcriptional regulator [Cohnella sp. LGH]